MIEELVRPMRCHICQKPMYYSGDPRHVPEVYVKVFSDNAKDAFFAHVKCWNERMNVQ